MIEKKLVMEVRNLYKKGKKLDEITRKSKLNLRQVKYILYEKNSK